MDYRRYAMQVECQECGEFFEDGHTPDCPTLQWLPTEQELLQDYEYQYRAGV